MLGQARQAGSKEGPSRKIEGMKQFILKQLMPGRLPPQFGQRVQIVERERYSKVRRNDLQVSTVNDAEGLAQNLVASHDFVEAPPQDLDTARRGDSEAVEN